MRLAPSYSLTGAMNEIHETFVPPFHRPADPNWTLNHSLLFSLLNRQVPLQVNDTMVCARHATSLQWLDNAILVDDFDWNNAEDCRRLVRFTEFNVENVRVHQPSSLVQASCTSYSVFSKTRPR